MAILISGLICVLLIDPQQNWIRTVCTPAGTTPMPRPKGLIEEWSVTPGQYQTCPRRTINSISAVVTNRQMNGTFVQQTVTKF